MQYMFRSLVRSLKPLREVKEFSSIAGNDYVKLNHNIIPCQDPSSTKSPILILHGLMGHLGNWRGISSQKDLTKDHTVVVADLRNHGASPRMDSMDYNSTSKDIAALIESLGGHAIVVGHSLGGKIAMATALNYPHLVTGLVVVDIMPVEYAPANKELKGVHTILEAVCSAPIGPGATRQSVDAHLAANGVPDAAVRMFLLTNLVSNPEGGMLWKPDVHTLRRHYDEVRCFGVTAGSKYDGPTLLMRGGRSGYVDPTVEEELMGKYFTNCEFSVIEDAGHWLHAEKPLVFIQQLRDFLDRNSC